MHRTSTETRSASSSTSSVAKRLSAYTAAASGAIAAAASGTHAAVTIVTLPTAQTGTGIGFSIQAAMTAGTGYFDVLAAPGTQIYWRLSGGQGPKIGLFANQRWDGGLLGTGVSIFNGLNTGGTGAWVGRAATTQSFGQEGVSLAVGGTGYIGFRVPVAEPGDWRYGWIELKNIAGTLTVERWAYESSFNTPIQTPTVSAVPGGAGLAALAFGAAGVRGRRRQHR